MVLVIPKGPQWTNADFDVFVIYDTTPFGLSLSITMSMSIANGRAPGGPARLMTGYPGVLHSDSRAKYAVAFFKHRSPLSVAHTLQVVGPAPSGFRGL